MLPSVYVHHLFFDLMYVFTYPLGCEYMKPSHKPSFRTVVFLLSMSSGILCQLYTILTYDREMVLLCSTTMAVAWQGITKVYEFVFNFRKMRATVLFLYRMSRQCDTQPIEQQILVSWSRKFEWCIRVFTAVVMGACICFCMLPLFLFVTTGKWELMLPIFVPGCDENTVPGFVVHTMVQLNLLFVSGFGLLGADLTIFLLTIYVCPLSDLLMYKLRTLGDMLVMWPSAVAGRPTSQYVNAIVRMHMEYIMFMETMSHLWYKVFIFEIMLNGISMCLIIFVLTQYTWFPLYLFWGMFFVKTFAVCAIGTMVDKYVSELKSCTLYKQPI